jgi:hypothetical protein
VSTQTPQLNTQITAGTAGKHIDTACAEQPLRGLRRTP